MTAPAHPPEGIITCLFTDIEGSTDLSLALLPDAYRDLIRRHHELLEGLVAEHHGYQVDRAGDGLFVTFDQARNALACAVAIQTRLRDDPLRADDRQGRSHQVSVRIGLYKARRDVFFTDFGNYVDREINLASRVITGAVGGQILVSQEAREQTGEADGYGWKAWPNRRLKNFETPEILYELLWDGRSRGEPGARFFPDWYLGEQSRYIPRPAKENEILAHFAALRPDGSVPRLVTLHGFGGMGKTRLAITCALQCVSLFAGRVYAIKLDHTLPSVDALAQAIGAPLGLTGEFAQPDRLIAALQDLNALLLLDNYESVHGPETQAFLRDLINRTRDLRLLVTGREAVKVAGLEQIVPVQGLAVTEAEGLFISRARLRKPDWQPADEAERAALRRILDLTDRIPLALEIVAAGMGEDVHDNIQAVADSLEATPRPELPPGYASNSPEDRHRSLTRCLDWSYERLNPTTQDGFARLGLFATSFSSKDVRDACGLENAPSLLTRLLQAALLYRPEQARSRFDHLRPTRDYAREKLANHPDGDALCDRYVGYYVRLVAANANVNVPAQKAVLDAEWRNALEAAEIAGQSNDWRSLEPLSSGLRYFLYLSIYGAEATRLQDLARIATHSAGSMLGEANCIWRLGDIGLGRSDHEMARKRFEEALEMYRQVGSVLGEANCIWRLGDLALGRSDHDTARQRYEEAQPLYRQVRDVLGEAHCIQRLGNIALRHSDPETARQRYEEALPMFRQVRDVRGQANCIQRLGDIALLRSDDTTARNRYEEALPMYRQVGDVRGQANCIKSLGDLALRRPDDITARTLFEEALPMYRQAGSVQGEADCIHRLGNIALRRSDHNTARQCYEEALRLYEQIREPYSIGLTYRRLARLAQDDMERSQYVELARTAWTSIGYDYWIRELDEEFGKE